MSTKNLAYYLGLRYPYEVHEREESYFVTHPDLDGCMAEGTTLNDALSNLADSRELWIEARLNGGYDVPEPYSDSEESSGRLSLRMTPEVHSKLARIAERRGVSLNLLLNSVLASYAGGAEPLDSVLSEIKTAIKEMSAAPIPVVQAASARQAVRTALLPDYNALGGSATSMLGDSAARALLRTGKGTLNG